MIPIFNAHLMSRRGSRKIHTKTVRGMTSWAHGKFRETLKSKCDKKGKVMFNHPNLILAKHVHLPVG